MSRIKIIIVTALFVLVSLAATLAPVGVMAAPTPKPCTKQVFRSGSKGACVGHIQNMLNATNKAGLSADSKFGPKTKAAVKAWQTKERIGVDGVVGADTWTTLCVAGNTPGTLQQQAGCDKRVLCTERKVSIGTNSRSLCVKPIQIILNFANGAGLDTDGKFGPKTKAAVIAWQKKQKQTDKSIRVDGVVGPQTWKTLCATGPGALAQQALGCK
jgi:peptidoglycan hydrolase-like protein with peptidoglycan-binding domain